LIINRCTQYKHYCMAVVMESTSQANRKTHKKPGTLPKELWSSTFSFITITASKTSRIAQRRSIR
jgi:hypothetical protein